MAAPGLSASVVNFSRNTTTGRVIYQVDVDGTDLTGFCTGGPCQVLLEFRDTAGTWNSAYSTYYFGSTIQFTGAFGWTPLAINGARATVLNGDYAVASSVVAISDSVRSQVAGIAGITWNRSATTGTASWAATVDTSAIPTSACSESFCQLQLVAEDTAHVEHILNQGAISNFYRDHFEWNGNYGLWTPVYRIKAVYGSLSSSWVSVTDSVQATGLGLAVDSFSRNDSTARVVWDVQIDVAALPSSACGTSFCPLQLIAELEGGAEMTLDQGPISNYYASSNDWSGGLNGWTKVLRLQARWGTISSAWVAVEDSPREEALELANVVFDRDQTTGNVAWSADIEFSAIDPGCPSYPCRPKLYAQDYDGNEYVMYDGVIANYYHDTQTWRANFGQWTSIKRLQVRYLSYASNWVNVDDVSRQQNISFTANEFLRNPTTGNLDWNVDVNLSSLNPNLCTVFGGCPIRLLAVDSTGAEHPLQSSWLSNWYTQSLPMSGTYAGTETIVNLRASYGSFNSNWIPSSEAITGGHDLDQAATLLIGYAGGAALGSAACTLVFPIGTHAAHSSLTDQDMACRTALAASGTSLKTAIIGVLVVEGGAYVTHLLTELGLSRPATGMTSTGTLPSNCGWVNLEISCYSAGTTTVTRPDDAPPTYDQNYEDNLYENSNLNSPVDVGIVVAVAVGVAVEEAVRLELLRSCVAQVTKIDSFSGLPAGTEAGLVGDDCGTKNIFFVGPDLPEPTAHDVGVISTNPALMLLTYASNVEKGTKPNVRDLPGCAGVLLAGHDCDEYPYWATEENNALNPPDVLPMNAYQNRLQGSRYGTFVLKCALGASPRNSVGRKFIVVYSWLLPTGGLCGKK